jgi:hypothetical protein
VVNPLYVEEKFVQTIDKKAQCSSSHYSKKKSSLIRENKNEDACSILQTSNT